MIGVNPLLDALLLQSLKGTASIQERGTQPAAPVIAGQPIRSASGDNDLTDQSRHKPKGQGTQSGYRSIYSGTSTVITLNETARIIADVMAKYPRESFDPLIKLLPLTSFAAASRGVIAAYLREAVEQSGLFYEAHLAKWYKGEYPESLLRKEPQFHRFLPSAELSKSIQLLEENSLKRPEDKMQFMLRHQLELMANPVLRMEGQLLTGLPFCFLIQHGWSLEDSDPANARSPELAKWDLMFRLEHHSFEYVDITITLKGTELDIVLLGCNGLLQELFRRDFPRLREQFVELGITRSDYTRKLYSRFDSKQPFTLPPVLTLYSKKHGSAFEDEYGDEAHRVFEKAVRHRLTNHTSSEIIALLMNLDMDSRVPDCLYSIAEVLIDWAISKIDRLED